MSEELHKLYSTEHEQNGEWSRWTKCDYSWERLDKDFPPGDGSLVSQLAAIVRSQHVRLATATELLREMQAMLEQLPTGIDTEADEKDTSPEDMVAHIGGLMWKRLAAFLGEQT